MSVLDSLTSKPDKEEEFHRHRKKGERLRGKQSEKAADHLGKASRLAREFAEDATQDSTVETWSKIADYLSQLEEAEREKAEARVQDEPVPTPDFDPGTSDSGVTFDDVGGHEEVVQTLRENVVAQFQGTDEYREALGAGPVNGVLMYGPPGTGKSLLAEAVAGELGIDYIEARSSEISSKYVGEAGKNVRALFEQVRESEPCVLFIDEIDAVVRDRGKGDKHDSEFEKVSEFLQEMQSIQGRDILVIAATNELDELDDAIKRSGRFDEKIHVGLPGREARRKIFQVHLSDRSVDESSIEWDDLLDWTQNYSGADIEAVVNAAARKANLESIQEDRLCPIDYRHLLTAVSEVEPSTEYWNNHETRGGESL